MGTDESRAGEVLASKYRLEALLGSGGMGHVYRAVNEDVGRAVAIKVLRREHATNQEVVQRFMREARTSNLVRHPNVVDVLDIGKDETGSPFIVQELLSGEDLARYVERRGGKLALEEIVELLCPVIDAVAEAHNQGVVHRDLKPENVFLATVNGRRVPKLLDFGISKVRNAGVRATDVGVLMGTPAYMPPEQVQGSRDADARSDVWALGVILFELLTGRMPFEAQDAPALFVAIATKDAPEIVKIDPTIAPNVSRIVERCLRRLPAERYPSAAELSRDLRHVLSGTELEATGVRSVPPPPLAAPAPASAPALVAARPAPKPAVDDVPDLDIPAPFAATIATRGGPPPPSSRGVSAARPAEGQRTVQGIPALSVGASADEDDDLGDLLTNDPAAPVGHVAPRPPPSARTVSSPELGHAVRPSQGRLAADQKLSGVGLAPGAIASSPRRPYEGVASSHVPGAFTRAADSDFSWLVGLGVLAFVFMGTLGVLIPVFRQPDGLQIGKSLVGDKTLIMAVQLALTLLATGFGATRARRGWQAWTGSLAGGRVGAVVNVLFAAGAAFLAIEFFRAAW